MHQSLAIARLVGPVLSAIGIGMLANQVTYREMAAQFLRGFPFIYFSGVLTLVAGLGIVMLALGGFITFTGYVA
ncbi:MAG: hypothetical protein WBW99_14545 [Pseudolabrys sp.]